MGQQPVAEHADQLAMKVDILLQRLIVHGTRDRSVEPRELIPRGPDGGCPEVTGVYIH
jgi:hypothetical protein